MTLAVHCSRSSSPRRLLPVLALQHAVPCVVLSVTRRRRRAPASAPLLVVVARAWWLFLLTSLRRRLPRTAAAAAVAASRSVPSSSPSHGCYLLSPIAAAVLGIWGKKQNHGPSSGARGKLVRARLYRRGSRVPEGAGCLDWTAGDPWGRGAWRPSVQLGLGVQATHRECGCGSRSPARGPVAEGCPVPVG